MTTSVPNLLEWRGTVRGDEVEALHAEAFGHDPVDFDWASQLEAHSLGWVTARDEGELIGFANVAWDGASHAWLVDVIVARRARRQGIGAALVKEATRRAAEAGCEWLHVDFEGRLRAFYHDSCGFTPIDAGVIRLRL